MKYFIRKCEQITSINSSQTIELDADYFKTLSDFPFRENPDFGNPEEDFLRYIEEYINICATEGFPEELNEEVAEQLNKLIENIEWKEVMNSKWKGETIWTESVEKSKDGSVVTRYFTSD